MIKEETKNKGLLKWLFIFIFVIGFGILLYPFISQYLYYQSSQVVVEEFYEEVDQLPDQETEERLALARAYNSTLYEGYGQNDLALDTVDPFTNEDKAAGRAEYARMLEVKEQIGTISVPRINQELPVFAGTSEEVLQRGVGHLEGTSLPVGGEGTHSVITAHRGLPSARLFTDLDDMVIGDEFYFTNLEETLAYRVIDITVIEPDEIEYLEIESGKDYMTLLTCTPYMVNSHRLLVKGERVLYNPENQDKQETQNQNFNLCLYLFIFIILMIILYILMRRRKQKKRLNDEKQEKDKYGRKD